MTLAEHFQGRIVNQNLAHECHRVFPQGRSVEATILTFDMQKFDDEFMGVEEDTLVQTSPLPLFNQFNKEGEGTQ